MRKVSFLMLMLVGLLVSGTAMAQALSPRWIYNEDEPLILSVDQILENCVYDGDGQGVDALIDGDMGTYFHSSYGDSGNDHFPLDDTKHWIIFDLGESAPSTLMLHFDARQGNGAAWTDTPNDITLFICSEIDEEGNGEWEEFDHIGPIWDSQDIGSGAHYTGTPYTIEKSYRYIKFQVNGTTTNRTVGGDGANAKTKFFSLSEINFYAPEWLDDKAILLSNLVDSILNIDIAYTEGDGPGFTPADIVEAYETALGEAQMAVTEEHSDDEYEAYGAALLDAFNALKNGEIKVGDGYYYIVNADEAFYAQQATDMAMCNSASFAGLRWGKFQSGEGAAEDVDNTRNAYYIWKFYALENGNYYIQNFGSQQYIGKNTTNSSVIGMTATATADNEYILKSVGGGQFNLVSIGTSSYWCHPAGHSNGAGSTGNVVGWTGGYGSNSAWKMVKLEDESILDEILEENRKAALQQEFKLLCDTAATTRDLCFTYGYNEEDALITNADDDDENCQFLSNAKETAEGAYIKLIDGKTNEDADKTAHFHSTYSNAGPGNVNHNLQIRLHEPVQKIIARLWGRDNTSYIDTPKTMAIYVTNDDELGNDAFSENEDWTYVSTIGDDWPLDNIKAGMKLETNGIDFGAPYKYVRFVVLQTYSVALGQTRYNTHTGIPYFVLSEFQLFPYDISKENSQYYYVEGMKDAVDNMMNLVAEGKDKIANKTATEQDVEAIRTALNTVRGMIGYPKVYNGVYENAVELAQTAIEGDGVGMFPEGSVQAYLDAVEANYTATNPTHPDKTKLEAGEAGLKALMADMYAKLKLPEPGKYYYIKMGPTSKAHPGKYLFTDKNRLDGVHDADFVCGGLEDGIFNKQEDARFMWRFTENTTLTEDGPNKAYMVQNLACGQFPALPATSGYYYSYMTANDSTSRYLHYVGNASFQLVNPDLSGTIRATYAYAGTADEDGNYPTDVTIRLAENSTGLNANDRFDWQIVEVDEDQVETALVYLTDNMINIVSLPFSLDGEGDLSFSSINSGLKTYKLAGMEVEAPAEGEEGETTTKLYLKEADVFAAGEPMICITGNPENWDAENTEMRDFAFLLPKDLTIKSGKANGLRATVASKASPKASGIGYFDGHNLKASGEDGVTTSDLSGYIFPAECQNSEDYDLVLTFGNVKVDAVTSATAATATVVNVYDLNGKLVKKAAMSSEAIKNLTKGIYVVGGKKVSVK